MLVDYVGELVALISIVILVYLIRSLAKTFERLMSANGNAGAETKSPEELARIMGDMMNDLAKKKADRDRKQRARDGDTEDLSDGEVETILNTGEISEEPNA
jgi:Mg2+/Co2+ transporter CorB